MKPIEIKPERAAQMLRELADELEQADITLTALELDNWESIKKGSLRIKWGPQG